MNVGNYCRRTICKVTKDATALRAARILRDEHVGSVIVVEDEVPIGIVTDRDIAVRVLAEGRDPARCKVKEIMSTPVSTLPIDADIAEAARAMRAARVRRLPVVARDGKLYGVIAMDDLLVRFARQFSTLARAVSTEQRNEQRNEQRSERSDAEARR